MEHTKHIKTVKKWCGVNEKTMVKLVGKITKLMIMHAMFIKEKHNGGGISDTDAYCQWSDMMNIEKDVMWQSYKQCIDHQTYLKTWDVTIDVVKMMRFVRIPFKSYRQVFNIVKDRWRYM